MLFCSPALGSLPLFRVSSSKFAQLFGPEVEDIYAEFFRKKKKRKETAQVLFALFLSHFPVQTPSVHGVLVRATTHPPLLSPQSTGSRMPKEVSQKMRKINQIFISDPDKVSRHSVT